MTASKVMWSTTDPQGRTVSLLTVTYEARERARKHPGADHMTPEEARLTVEEPHIIQESMANATRRSYYRYQEEVGKPPYMRTTVATDVPEGVDGDAVAISWGRQGSTSRSEQPVYFRKRN